MFPGRNILLYPFSLLYGLITTIRNLLYDWKLLPSHEFSFPVICVGNITVGGTGKTPHTEYLAALFAKSFKIAILSRGYKRRSKGFIRATSSSKVFDIGDEPLQICRKFPEIIVAVDSNRVRGIKRIIKENPGTEVIILDDGFQHRRVLPGLAILLTDFERLFTRDHLLPYGNLRESKSNMRRADIIVVTKTPPDFAPIQRRLICKEINKAPYQNLFFSTTIYKDPVPVFENIMLQGKTCPEILRHGNAILLVTGIANPRPLKRHLEFFKTQIKHLCFPDHHNYTEKDLARITEAFNELNSQVKYIITTEKDSARFRELIHIENSIKQYFYYIPVGIHFLNDDKEYFDNLMTDYVRKNKRNNRVSEF
jgi:tetraacyldisaccharide 4'-kinase